jgi:hypothetical protein
LLQLQSTRTFSKRFPKSLHDMHVLQSLGSCDRRLSSIDSEVAGERESEPTSDQHHNQNQNLQMIAIEECDDQPRVAVVTRMVE